jgi:ATP-dependent RNA helicase RhlE
MSFSSLGLSEPLVRAVTEEGYQTPTPIQRQAIPVVLAGGDVLAGAQTGTGKTAGFVLPMLQRLTLSAAAGPRHARRPLRALILTPTRELAAQVEASVRAYGKHLKLVSMVAIGGVGMSPQTAQLKRGVDILVATPGRLLDHHGQRNVDFASVEIFVLDEADRMLDMGFIHDIKRVLALLPKRRQNLLFSATFSDDIRELASALLDSPAMIDVAPRNATVDMIDQVVHPVDRGRKRALLSALIGRNDWRQVLVFTRTKHGANKLAEQLNDDGIRALPIHGNKSQNARTRALAEFKAGDLRVLVATDIAARGIDIQELPHVVNYDLPNVPEDYVHRIGRTGRAGSAGEAVSLVSVDELAFLRDIEKLLRRTIRRQSIEGFEPDPSARPEPVSQRNGQHPRGAANAAHRARSSGGAAQQRQRMDAPRAASPTSRAGSRSDAPAVQRTNGRPAQPVQRAPAHASAQTPGHRAARRRTFGK